MKITLMPTEKTPRRALIRHQDAHAVFTSVEDAKQFLNHPGSLPEIANAYILTQQGFAPSKLVTITGTPSKVCAVCETPTESDPCEEHQTVQMCQQEKRTFFGGQTCIRPENHIGDHYGAPDEHNVIATWNNSLVRTGRFDWHGYCTRCLTVNKEFDSETCSTCNYWEKLYPEYSAENTNIVVVDGEAYEWRPGRSGAFAGRKAIVRWDNGRETEPRDWLWHLDYIPEDEQHRFQPNATIEWVKELEMISHD